MESSHICIKRRLELTFYKPCFSISYNYKFVIFHVFCSCNVCYIAYITVKHTITYIEFNKYGFYIQWRKQTRFKEGMAQKGPLLTFMNPKTNIVYFQYIYNIYMALYIWINSLVYIVAWMYVQLRIQDFIWRWQTF